MCMNMIVIQNHANRISVYFTFIKGIHNKTRVKIDYNLREQQFH